MSGLQFDLSTVQHTALQSFALGAGHAGHIRVHRGRTTGADAVFCGAGGPLLGEYAGRIRAALAAALIEELDKLYAALQSGDTASYLTAYRRDCLTLRREVQLLWQDVKEKVTALDVDDQFGLVVRRADGTVETIRTGEVSVRGLYGYVE